MGKDLIQELYQFGEYIISQDEQQGIFNAFKSNWKVPEIGKKVSEKIICIDFDDEISLELIDGAQLPDNHLYYYISETNHPPVLMAYKGLLRSLFSTKY